MRVNSAVFDLRALVLCLLQTGRHWAGRGRGGGEGLGENPGENGTGSVREADKERAGSRIP